MKERISSKMKNKKISLVTYIICLIVLVLIIGILVYSILKNNNGKNNLPVNNNNIKNTTAQTQNKIGDYFILYNGIEMKVKTGVQDLADMEINETNNSKYNTKYYNYEDGKYVGESIGEFGEPTYDGVSIVNGVKNIAISKKYNAVPRNYSTIKELPEELMELADYTTIDTHSIDLDGDEKQEYIICCTVNYAKNEIGDGEPKASSIIMLFDSNYKKIADLVNLENGFWANIKEEDKKIFLTLNDVNYIDIDNDGIMEIIIKIPTYEGTKISVVKYNEGKVVGETNLEANVLP